MGLFDFFQGYDLRLLDPDTSKVIEGAHYLTLGNVDRAVAWLEKYDLVDPNSVNRSGRTTYATRNTNEIPESLEHVMI